MLRREHRGHHSLKPFMATRILAGKIANLGKMYTFSLGAIVRVSRLPHIGRRRAPAGPPSRRRPARAERTAGPEAGPRRSTRASLWSLCDTGAEVYLLLEMKRFVSAVPTWSQQPTTYINRQRSKIVYKYLRTGRGGANHNWVILCLQCFNVVSNLEICSKWQYHTESYKKERLELFFFNKKSHPRKSCQTILN